ncbi:hypothetical protein GDO81_024611 [Engystomops pustulosus]|uniref:Uncharacterized protein n=1 Tax=Engystomops pustulosus TaxID=76066 RepID=A0AAV6Z1L6_ENGPU|nr:hypothetical protein GDO81_024611 [Engystomops pustulosus]
MLALFRTMSSRLSLLSKSHTSANQVPSSFWFCEAQVLGRWSASTMKAPGTYLIDNCLHILFFRSTDLITIVLSFSSNPVLRLDHAPPPIVLTHFLDVSP